MRAFVPVFLVLIISISSFKHAAIYVSFKLKQDYIAQNLCIERDVKDSTCAGCCQLKKKQAEQHESEDGSVPERKVNVNIEWFCSTKLSLQIQAKDEYFKPWVFSVIDYKSYYSADCFHPPRFIG